MTTMREARLVLRPLSPFLSPLQSDTLWGQVAWAIRYSEGKDALDALLARYRDAGEPPLVLSSPLLAGTLPAPILRPLRQAEQKALAGEFYGEVSPRTLRLSLAALKQIGTVSYLDLAIWRELAGGLAPLDLVRRFFRLELCPEQGGAPERLDCQATFADCPVFHEGRCRHLARWLRRWLQEHGPDEPTPVCLVRTAAVTKNTINRLTDTTVAGAGSLYLQEEAVYTGLLEVRLLLAEDLAADLARVRRWFEAVGMGGYGSGASVGKGRFAVDDLRLLPPGDPAALPRPVGANGFMALSAYVPRLGEPTVGWYRLRVKRGKLGGELATAARGVWKKPLLMCEPGSVFHDEPPRAWYGRLVAGISPFEKDVVQCGVALALPVHLAEGEGKGGSA